MPQEHQASDVGNAGAAASFHKIAMDGSGNFTLDETNAGVPRCAAVPQMPPHLIENPKDTTMDHTVFEEPVSVVVGLGFVKHINTPMDAFTFLNEWPVHQARSAHAAALKLCRAAICGDVDCETARGVFMEFALANHLLAPEMTALELPKIAVPTTLAA